MDKSFTSVNPATGAVIAAYGEHTDQELEAILAQSHGALRCWRKFRMDERAACLHKLADMLEAGTDELAALITAEMGKPVGEARAEIKRCASGCRFYADHAPEMLAPETPPGAPEDAQIVYDPIGVVLGIMPWNFPFWQALRCAAPVLMAGNSFLLKHAPSVTGCALAIEDLFTRCGAPEGLLRVLRISEERVASVIEDRRVRAVSLTGSCRAGSAVAAVAGRAIKKCVLELGGSDPFVVLEDADLHLAATTAVAARFYNAGQTCVSAKRFLVARKVVREFEERMVHAVGLLKMGDPCDAATRVGPMARADLRDTLHAQVSRSVEMGAKTLLDGGPVEGPGFFYSPVVLGDVRPGMPVFEQEVFGPVASITSFATPEDALRLANQTPYGLGGSVWTANAALGRKLASFIEAGTVAVNALVKSDPRLPFGGVKNSGFGRELGRQGLLEFVNVKVLRIP
ncbi:NAD-dependent succinate-semialdehyde dehydrogenase [Fundidesulfovibrio agrisoli]|uniref:NAD-dependent succinate-semialdehyde dehydrogenase n=1 Tax=Fundidesulfovibrio agrisoli TaxID=2922717 RepID=UPI001FADF6A5|nr:NAD-dependent succinate-semialdehyde dehydrogenase [Fundidesulfovibrio agrisoli]